MSTANSIEPRAPLPPLQRILTWILLVALIAMVADGLVMGQLAAKLATPGHELAAKNLLAGCRNLLYILLGAASLTGYVLLLIRRRSGTTASPET